MASVKEWATIICLSVIACTMLELITPSGKMEKMMRFVFGIFMIVALITPLLGTVKKINIDLKHQNNTINKKSSRFEKKIDNEVINIASNNIRTLVTQELKKINVQAQKVEIFMDTLDESCISIIKVRVYLYDKDEKKKREVKELLERSLGLETEVAIYRG